MKKTILAAAVLLLASSFRPAAAQDENNTAGAAPQTEALTDGDNTLPYGKMLALSQAELQAARFKYNDNRNQWTLVKGYVADPDMLRYMSTPFHPNTSDYRVLIQGAAAGTSYVEVAFYADDTYQSILSWMRRHGADLDETSSGNLTKTTCTWEGYTLELQMIATRTAETRTTTNTSTTSTTSSAAQPNGGRPVVSSTAQTGNQASTAPAPASRPSGPSDNARPAPAPAATTRTNTTTQSTSQTVDTSFNTYRYYIYTGAEPSSPWHDKQASKQAARDDKGKKKQNVSDLM